jgi:hypothetical protein
VFGCVAHATDVALAHPTPQRDGRFVIDGIDAWHEQAERRRNATTRQFPRMKTRRLRRLDDVRAIERLSVDCSYDLNGTVGNPVASNFTATMMAMFLCNDKREPIFVPARTTTRFVKP